MLRHYEQQGGGVRVYTQNLLPKLFTIGKHHEFVAMYQNPALIGTYASYANVEETALRVPGTVLWDQLAVPWIERKRKLDLIFNLKLTVPLAARTRTVFVMHGSEWFVIPETFLWYDRWYFKCFAPLYCRRAHAFITVSHTVKRDVVSHTDVNPKKVFPVYNGYDSDVFRVIGDRDRLQAVQERYRLPERFILWVGQRYPPKNCGRLFQAFARIKGDIPHTLVIAGEQRWRAEQELELVKDLGIQDRVQFAGWVSHDDLPVFYNLADLFVFPSLCEGFGIPLLEAMACGCPIVAANTCTPPEIVDGAGYLVNPLDVTEIATGIKEVLSDRGRRDEMARRGLARVQSFGWTQCARDTLTVLENASF
jgi:glycosyltransferase involved in cell wall biosynthesis